MLWWLLCLAATAEPWLSRLRRQRRLTRQTRPPQRHPRSSRKVFQAGQEALNHNQLDEAERDFREVLSANPEVGGAYANLGVVYMRRKQWTKALEMLRKAERLMPQVPGNPTKYRPRLLPAK